MNGRLRAGGRWLATAVGLSAAAYGAFAAMAWYRYGVVSPPDPAEADALLDRFMPVYEIVERHHIAVAAPAATTLDAARHARLESSPLVRAIFRAREVLMGASADRHARAPGLLADVQALGWGVLAEVPGREVVVGAVTKPWEADVTFRALPPDRFAGFSEPGYVKIVWTLRADPRGPTASVFRTETRAVATDAEARARFRRYWSFVSPGIITIRWALLRPVQKDAERRARAAVSRQDVLPDPDPRVENDRAGRLHADRIEIELGDGGAGLGERGHRQDDAAQRRFVERP
jgi:hypothetical protein